MWKLKKKSGKARLGEMTLHGKTFETPIFMPVGTCGSVKGTFPWQLEDRYPIILGNTYHLYLRPGDQLVHDLGGLHQFESWPNALLTDSGGYQAFSLSSSKYTDEGVHFKSHLDGSNHFFSPQRSMEIQRNLGADIIMAFDHCAPYGVSYEETKKAMDRTHRWLDECERVELKEHQNLFGIVQGGFFDDLRKQSADYIGNKNLPGFALGGLAVGEPQALLHEKLALFPEYLPEDKPRYVMGIGYPEDVVEAIYQGCDMMDCVLPTRNARNGQAFTSLGTISIKQEKYIKDESPLDPNCSCLVCTRFTKAYLRHLYKAGEMTAGMALTHHNLHYYADLIYQIRAAIKEDKLDEFRKKFYQRKT